ncbi:hypothetical protein [Xenorhabdus griffiniae]|uniref:hypothetical protein n=2 Tax=Xenorhabdus griffiniae TaxID=351672 RepID=UPI003BAF07B4
MSGHKTFSVPPKRGNQRPNMEQLTSSRGKINYRNSLRLRSPIAVVLTLAGHSEKLFAQFQSEKYFADGYANIFGHLSNSLISSLTVRLAFGRNLGGSPIISGWLLNSLIFNHTANMQSGHNLHGAFSDAQTLRPSFSQSQKEKDSTANATLWRNSDLSYMLNQLVSYYSDDALVLRFSDLSFRSQASITHAEKLALELEGLLASTLSFISSINSWGKRIPLYPDLLFLCPVAIRLISKKCFNTYKDTPLNKIPKVFKQIPLDVFKHYDVMYLNTFIDMRVKIATPRSAANTIEASNQQPLTGVTIMAIQQHNQTRLKFTFLIASGTQRLVDLHPVRLITVLADSEGEARLLAGISSLIFVSRKAWDIGIDTPFNCSDMSTVQGANHA